MPKSKARDKTIEVLAYIVQVVGIGTNIVSHIKKLRLI